MKKEALRKHLTNSEIVGCESPIESMLASALLMTMGAHMYERANGVFGANAPCPLQMQFQWPEGKYRIDIVLFGSAHGARLAIECDGHDFHEKTKEQAARDKSKDRYIAECGWRMVRFTGSEIWADPLACAQQAFRIAMDMESSAAESAYLSRLEAA